MKNINLSHLKQLDEDESFGLKWCIDNSSVVKYSQWLNDHHPYVSLTLLSDITHYDISILREYFSIEVEMELGGGVILYHLD